MYDSVDVALPGGGVLAKALGTEHTPGFGLASPRNPSGRFGSTGKHSVPPMPLTLPQSVRAVLFQHGALRKTSGVGNIMTCASSPTALKITVSPVRTCRDDGNKPKIS